MPDAASAKRFHETWVAGVKQYYPGIPKDSYIVSWDNAPEWERDSAGAVYEQVKAFILATSGATAKLTRNQKSQFVAICWIGQMYKHFPDPKPSYVADWTDLPDWHKETDADIFERIEKDVQFAW